MARLSINAIIFWLWHSAHPLIFVPFGLTYPTPWMWKDDIFYYIGPWPTSPWQLLVTFCQRCAKFRVESTLAHSTQFNFELTFELIFECATLWMPIHWAEWGFIGLVRTIPFNSHSRIDSLLSKSSHGWECECARMAFELDTTLIQCWIHYSEKTYETESKAETKEKP